MTMKYSVVKYLDKNAPFAQNSDALQEILNELDIEVIDSIAKTITYNWCMTVHLTTREQLDRGIRYFDFRTMPHLFSWQLKMKLINMFTLQILPNDNLTLYRN